MDWLWFFFNMAMGMALIVIPIVAVFAWMIYLTMVLYRKIANKNEFRYLIGKHIRRRDYFDI